jgi:phospholipid transport system substrate-binding protein
MGKESRNGFWLRLLCSTLVLLVVCQLAGADNNDPNDPNDPNEPKDPKELLSSKSADNNDPNDPNDPNELKDPKELLSSKWSAVISVLQNNELEQQVKEKKISKIVEPLFDFPLMAKLSLGRKHWPKLDESQREKFTQLFSERLKRTYWRKIALYKDEKVLFKPTEQKKKIYHIPTELVYKEKKVAILYKLRKVEKSWKIYDVEIQGVSVLLTYRSQFDEILNRGTVKDLLSRLEKPPDD